MCKNFLQRALVSSICAAIVAMLIILSHTPKWSVLFLAGVALIQSTALFEFISLARKKGCLPAAPLLYGISLLYLLACYLSSFIPRAGFLPQFVLTVGAVIMPLPFLCRLSNSLNSLASTVLGFVAITIPFSLLIDIDFLPRLHNGSPTSFWLTWVLVTTKGSDVAAYISGKLFGKTALAPSVSPNKTVEGAVCGVLGSAILGLVIAKIWPYTPSTSIASTTWLALGAIMGLAAVLGDLAESLIKRDANIKDSNSIPGLGGVLDMVDSMIFAVPILHIYLKVTGVFIVL